MAYNGTTAASSVSNPPRSLVQGLGGHAGSTGFDGMGHAGSHAGGLWSYVSTNTTAEVVGSDFFTDGKALGMRVGDMVLGVSHTTSVGSSGVAWVGVVSYVSTAGAGLAAGINL
jgi:hypothetical protein